jgi:peptidoglycan hydrolase-like protein with peptidoglycan-binding domain
VINVRELTKYDDKKPLTYTEPKGTYWVGYLVADLKVGTKGKIVKFAQKLLNGAGLKVQEDALYGENTAKAVSDFQSKNSLAVTGEIDAKTWLKLTASNGIHI